jgi:rubrerythrin
MKAKPKMEVWRCPTCGYELQTTAVVEVCHPCPKVRYGHMTYLEKVAS